MGAGIINILKVVLAILSILFIIGAYQAVRDAGKKERHLHRN